MRVSFIENWRIRKAEDVDQILLEIIYIMYIRVKLGLKNKLKVSKLFYHRNHFWLSEKDFVFGMYTLLLRAPC